MVALHVILPLLLLVVAAVATAAEASGAAREKSVVRREGRVSLVLDSAGAASEEEDDTRDILNFNHSVQPGVPRLIHQTFRKKLVAGAYPNPVWEKSAQSWRKYFPEGEGEGHFRYQLWTDDELLSFYKHNCEREAGPLQLHHYRNKISVSDLGRYCLLWKLGGIYADLDYEPRANFYARFAPDKASLVESPYKGETYQNSLMASPVGLDYWLQVLRQARLRADRPGDANELSGPRLLESIPATHNRAVVQPLPCREFQRATHSEMDMSKGCGVLDAHTANEVLGIHWGTLSWRIDGLTGSGRDRSIETQHLFQQLFSTLHPEADSEHQTTTKPVH